MSFPTFVGATTVFASSISYPSGIQAGDLLLFFGSYGTWTTKVSGLVQLTTVSSYKFADGTETGSISMGVGAAWGIVVLRNAATPEATEATGTLDTPNPPSLTPTGGVIDRMWVIWGQATTSANFSSPTVPSGFTLGAAATNGAISGYKTDTVATLDPAAFGDSDANTSGTNAVTLAAAFSFTGFNSLLFGSNF